LKIRSRKQGRREQQVGAGVDRRTVFLLRPRHGRVMAAQAGFDVRDRDSGSERREGATESARRVSLDDEQIGRLAKLGQDCGRDASDVRMRVFRTGAAEPRRRKGAHVEIRGIKLVLPGQDERRSHASRRQRPGDRCKLDRFGSGADDQPNVRGMQPSP
jgi:hypothetical protein